MRRLGRGEGSQRTARTPASSKRHAKWLAAFPAVPASAARVSTVRRAASPPHRLADMTAAVSRRTGNRAHDFAVQMRHHLQSFLTGSVAALAFGYYRVHQDVWYAAEAVRQRR